MNIRISLVLIYKHKCVQNREKWFQCEQKSGFRQLQNLEYGDAHFKLAVFVKSQFNDVSTDKGQLLRN